MSYILLLISIYSFVPCLVISIGLDDFNWMWIPVGSFLASFGWKMLTAYMYMKWIDSEERGEYIGEMITDEINKGGLGDPESNGSS